MRSKVFALLLISTFFAGFVQSQSNELLVKGQTGKLFLTHTVQPKENWYSIGRLYNISPKEIAPFNNLTMDKGLSIGEQLNIPLTTANFSQDGVKTAAESLVPVYYVIQEKEWMYRISVNHNKVPIANLEKWNHINGGQIKAGMPIIVGYLKVKTALSAFATGAASVPVTAAAGQGAGAVSQGSTAGQGAAANAARQVTAAAAQGTAGAGQVASAGGNAAAAGQTAAGDAPATVAKTETAMTNAPATSKPVNTPAGNTAGQAGAGQTTGAAGNGNAPAPVAKQETPVTNTPAPAAAPPAVSRPAETHTAANFKGGYFRSDFSDGGKSVSGMAGTFKSTSGWQDGKYYALMNNVPVGTIIRITLTSTNKSVYAKVLGQLPEMKESAGLTIRVSNSAASELGGGDGKFAVQVNY